MGTGGLVLGFSQGYTSLRPLIINLILISVNILTIILRGNKLYKSLSFLLLLRKENFIVNLPPKSNHSRI